MDEKLIVLDRINVLGDTLEYEFSFSKCLRKYFAFSEKFYVKYEFSVEQIPNAILVIPFICNVLPIAWVLDAKIVCDELDKDFYESIERFKKGYIDQYPDISFLGMVYPKKLIDTKTINEDRHNVVMFYSGGVDATATMIRHLQEKPLLVTLWGADLMPGDEGGWKVVYSNNYNTARLFGLDYTYVKTSFRTFINEIELHELVKAINEGYGWYHDFSHGIGIISHAAPITYYYGADLVYIAASVTDNDKEFYGASMPFIDENVKWAGIRVIHDGFHLNRQEKLDYISSYMKQNKKEIPLRVCWEIRDGNNCCHCEKCYRTLAGLLLTDSDPRRFGFDFAPERWPEIIDFLGKASSVDYTWMSVYSKATQICAENKGQNIFANELMKIGMQRWACDGHTLHNPNYE